MASTPAAIEDVLQRRLLVSHQRPFLTKQGEGATMGEIAMFLRLNECNLRCVFCDTKETWRKSLPQYKERQLWTVAQARDEILSKASPECSRLVVTGGEPLMQQESIAALLSVPPFDRWDIEVETNGTIFPKGLVDRDVQLNCSPKLSNAGMKPEECVFPDVLQNMIANFPKTYLKFVLADQRGLEEIIRYYLPVIPITFPRTHIIVSPEGTTVEQIDAVRDRLRDDVEGLGFTLGDRMQVRQNFE